jgi:hypothetical protein
MSFKIEVVKDFEKIVEDFKNQLNPDAYHE